MPFVALAADTRGQQKNISMFNLDVKSKLCDHFDSLESNQVVHKTLALRDTKLPAESLHKRQTHTFSP